MSKVLMGLVFLLSQKLVYSKNHQSYFQNILKDENNILNSTPHKKIQVLESNLKKNLKQLIKNLKIKSPTMSDDEIIDHIASLSSKDLEKIAPQYRQELKAMTDHILEELLDSPFQSHLNKSPLFKNILTSFKEQNIEKRRLLSWLKELKNAKSLHTSSLLSHGLSHQLDQTDISKKEVLAKLTSRDIEGHWLRGEIMEYRTDRKKTRKKMIKLGVTTSYLGTEVDLGYKVSFNITFSTNAKAEAEGRNNFIDNRGQLIFTQNNERRKINFSCEAELEFESVLTSSGKLMVLGNGFEYTKDETYKSSVAISSSTVALPEKIDGQIVTPNLLDHICHNDYLNKKSNGNSSAKESLEHMMKNLISSLRYKNELTECRDKTDCYGWWGNNLSLLKLSGTPECMPHSRENYHFCSIVGKEGAPCRFYDKNKKLITSGSGEQYYCDKGLVCTITEYPKKIGALGYSVSYTNAKAQCLPPK